ncbi:MAG: B12-binding domain-containing radical SAM protein [Chloroflexi bacterium]|nr:B12-binding domain-containing radical SAM protein [Chloroflexota bacterium]MCL5110265.1 B12-binding domain-containing radical SAM protein [Chloroflexota bacterium]
MKLLLIAPSWIDPELNRNSGFSFLPPLSLGILAALTPPDWEVRILDQNFERVDYDYPADLVGITLLTGLAPRAYAMADRFRAQGRKVVLGGIHATALPEEAAQHADSVVVGEAENLWPQVVSDLLAGSLRPVYRADARPDLAHWVRPRRELFPSRGFWLTTATQTTRGCPFRCNFCSVTQFFGHTYRFRPVPDVVDEVAGMGSRLVGFLDDNIVGNTRRAKELFRALIPLRIRWMSQGSLTMAEDEELLTLAERSGCIGMFVGLESINPAALASLGKPINIVSRYEAAIKRLHDHGIAVEGAFMFGLDEDDESVFERTLDFARQVRLELAQFAVLTPFPGTPLYSQMDAAGRIIDRDWGNYNARDVVFRPKGMAPERLKEGVDWSWREFYSLPSTLRQLGLWRRHLPCLWGLNLAFRRSLVEA